MGKRLSRCLAKQKLYFSTCSALTTKVIEGISLNLGKSFFPVHTQANSTGKINEFL